MFDFLEDIVETIEVVADYTLSGDAIEDAFTIAESTADATVDALLHIVD